MWKRQLPWPRIRMRFLLYDMTFVTKYSKLLCLIQKDSPVTLNRPYGICGLNSALLIQIQNSLGIESYFRTRTSKAHPLQKALEASGFGQEIFFDRASLACSLAVSGMNEKVFISNSDRSLTFPYYFPD